MLLFLASSAASAAAAASAVALEVPASLLLAEEDMALPFPLPFVAFPVVPVLVRAGAEDEMAPTWARAAAKSKSESSLNEVPPSCCSCSESESAIPWLSIRLWLCFRVTKTD